FRYGISILFVLLFALIPFGNTFAYQGGLLEGKPMIISLSSLGPKYSGEPLVTTVTDNDESTSYTLNSKHFLYYEFEQPISLIDSYYYIRTGGTQAVFINFYDENKV